MFNVYKNQLSRQTGSMNLTGPKTLPTIWYTYMTKYHISAIIFGHNFHIGTPYRGKRFWTHQIPTSCLPTLLIFIHIEHTFCICPFLVAFLYKNQLSRQTGSRNLTGPKTLPTIWHTYMKLVTKYQIPVINSCLEICDEKCAYTNVC
jgi:hypothetical protein